MKKYSFLMLSFIAISASLLYTSCSSLFAPKTPVSVATMNFDYTPPVSSAKGENIKVALINPQYVQTFTSANYDPYRTFVKNMGKDFEEMLIARGYTIIGPYNSFDDLVYAEKNSTDLVLLAEVTLDITGNYARKRDVPQIGQGYSKTYYDYLGNANIEGKINLSLAEPFTKTKLWIKSVSFEPTTVYFKSKSYTTGSIPVTDPGVWNPLVAGLSTVYQKALQTAWNHLDPSELAIKKKEAIEIKKNSNFQR